ncbi:MAG: transcription termination/antitermination NusG family protein [bacterium]
MDWIVLHVRPKCEKKMAGHCAFYSISHYLPLRRETKVYQRRKVTVDKPVFPGYVFAEVPRSERLAVIKSSSLVRIIEVLDQARFAHEIDQVRQALLVDATLGATAAIKSGKPVRITAGPFQGLEGVVVTVRGVTRVVLNVDMIGQAVRVDVDAAALEPVVD